jgi:phage terminase small subunit
LAETDLKNAYATLKRRHRRFVDEYLLGKKGSEAMLSIGFKGTRPDIAASKLLALPEVRAAVDERRAVLCEAVGLRQESVLRELMAIGFSDVRQLHNADGSLKSLTELDELTAKAIAGVEIEEAAPVKEGATPRPRVRKMRLWDKAKALGDLARFSGLEKTDPSAGGMGPGLTVIVQQIVGGLSQVQTVAGVAIAQHVIVDLPGPA